MIYVSENNSLFININHCNFRNIYLIDCMKNGHLIIGQAKLWLNLLIQDMKLLFCITLTPITTANQRTVSSHHVISTNRESVIFAKL